MDSLNFFMVRGKQQCQILQSGQRWELKWNHGICKLGRILLSGFTRVVRAKQKPYCRWERLSDQKAKGMRRLLFQSMLKRKRNDRTRGEVGTAWRNFISRWADKCLCSLRGIDQVEYQKRMIRRAKSQNRWRDVLTGRMMVWFRIFLLLMDNRKERINANNEKYCGAIKNKLLRMPLSHRLTISRRGVSVTGMGIFVTIFKKNKFWKRKQWTHSCDRCKCLLLLYNNKEDKIYAVYCHYSEQYDILIHIFRFNVEFGTVRAIYWICIVLITLTLFIANRTKDRGLK